MANTNTVFGASYLMDPFGGSASGKLLPFVVPASDHTAIFIGDFVTLAGGSGLSEDLNIGYLPTVKQSAATEVILGVVEGFGVDPANLEKIYRPADTHRTVWVNVNYNAFFVMQSAGTGAAADIGKVGDIVVGSGNTFTGLSGMQILHSDLGTTNGQIKIVGLAPGSEFGLYTKFVVMINEAAYKVVAGA
jgi:hypothetical protein